MIGRYTRPEMAHIWQDENKFRIWLEIEILACEAQAELGVIPGDAVQIIREKARFDIPRIEEIEREVKHDVIAFLTNVGEHVGRESRYIHLGMTSSDVLDTCLAVQMKQSGEFLLGGLEKLADVLARRAKEFKMTIMVGRTHGIHAEPTTFGLKLALWYDETRRNIERLKSAVDRISVGQVSGAVGTFEHLSPSIEEYVCRKLGLNPAPVSTQVLQRDRHAEFMCVLALIGSSLEKFATEIRHLQRTEVLEAEEPFEEGQTGSSAMPHKRNPVSCERVTGLARLLRSYAMAGLENIPLWHERDISHSSVERVILPDSTCALDFMLREMTRILSGLKVYPDRMKRNVGLTRGLIFSESVLLSLMEKGLIRKEAYTLVQRHALAAWKDPQGPSFQERLAQDPQIRKRLTAAEINSCFDLNRHLRHVDLIFRRVGL